MRGRRDRLTRSCPRGSYCLDTSRSETGSITLDPDRFVPCTADATKLRLEETSDERNCSAVTLASPEANGEENTAMVSVCLPRAVAPDIVPVILAFLYTDRLEFAPENGSDGFAKEYVDPGVGEKSRRVAATETCRPQGRSGFGRDSKEASSSNGSGGNRESGRNRGEKTSSTVRTIYPRSDYNSWSVRWPLCYDIYFWTAKFVGNKISLEPRELGIGRIHFLSCT